MAKIWEYFAQAFPPKSNFITEDIPDLSNKVIVVTGMSGHQIGNISCHVFLGGNSGIGYETVKVNDVCYMCSTSKFDWIIGIVT